VGEIKRGGGEANVGLDWKWQKKLERGEEIGKEGKGRPRGLKFFGRESIHEGRRREGLKYRPKNRSYWNKHKKGGGRVEVVTVLRQTISKASRKI